MQLLSSLLCLLSLVISHTAATPAPAPVPRLERSPPAPQSILAETPLHLSHTVPKNDHTLHIPTRDESTVLARRLLALSHTGTLTTTFPSNLSDTYPPYAHVPASVANAPIGLPEYIATCEASTHPGDPTVLALTVSTSTRNAVAGSNVSLTLSWWDEYVKLTHSAPWSAANLPRANLVGWLEELSPAEIEDADVVSCFTAVHADARWWLPGDSGAAHTGVWMRMRVEEVYWIGGFGDRAFIGWFDPEVWRAVSEDEWKGVRLPGEKP